MYRSICLSVELFEVLSMCCPSWQVLPVVVHNCNLDGIVGVCLSAAIEIQETWYRLVALVLHSSAHFTCYFFLPQQLPMASGWWFYDDLSPSGAKYIGQGLSAVVQRLDLSKLYGLVYLRQGSSESEEEALHGAVAGGQGSGVPGADRGEEAGVLEDTLAEPATAAGGEGMQAPHRSFEATMPKKKPRGKVRDGQQQKAVGGKGKGTSSQGQRANRRKQQQGKGVSETDVQGVRAVQEEPQQQQQQQNGGRQRRAASKGVAAVLQQLAEDGL